MNLLWQVLGVLLLLVLLGNSVNQTRNETNKNGGNRPEVNSSIKENQTRQSDWQLVQSADHGVSSRRSDSNTPSRAVGDTHGRSTRENHGKNGGSSVFCREVDGKVSGRPIFENERTDQKNWNRQQVVVVHSVKVLKVGQLDSNSHVQDERSRGKTVGKHPKIAKVQRIHVVLSLDTCGVTVCGKNRGEDHQQKGAQGHCGDLTAKPQNFTVGNQNDGQVLEDGVNWNRQVHQSLRGGVDHSNEKKSNRKPLLGLILVELSVSDDTELLQSADGENTNNTLDGQEEKVQVEAVTRKNVFVCHSHQDR